MCQYVISGQSTSPVHEILSEEQHRAKENAEGRGENMIVSRNPMQPLSAIPIRFDCVDVENSDSDSAPGMPPPHLSESIAASSSLGDLQSQSDYLSSYLSSSLLTGDQSSASPCSLDAGNGCNDNAGNDCQVVNRVDPVSGAAKVSDEKVRPREKMAVLALSENLLL